MVAVEEEEDDEKDSGKEVSRFERLVEALTATQRWSVIFFSIVFGKKCSPEPTDREKCKPRLSYQGNSACHPQPSHAPLVCDATNLNVVDDERECVYKRKDKHGPGDPIVPDN